MPSLFCSPPLCLHMLWCSCVGLGWVFTSWWEPRGSCAGRSFSVTFMLMASTSPCTSAEKAAQQPVHLAVEPALMLVRGEREKTQHRLYFNQFSHATNLFHKRKDSQLKEKVYFTYTSCILWKSAPSACNWGIQDPTWQKDVVGSYWGDWKGLKHTVVQSLTYKYTPCHTRLSKTVTRGVTKHWCVFSVSTFQPEE